MSAQVELTEEQVLAFLSKLGDGEAADMLEQATAWNAKLGNEPVASDDELHAWFIQELGINIPRVAVCEGHVAPFTFIADLYFRRRNRVILIAPRGGGKTFMVALLHYANGRLRKRVKAVSVGATEVQAGRTYNHLKEFIDERDHIAPKVAAEKVIFANKSEVEILPGSETAVNGPHPHIVHADEVEQMKPNVFSESRSMSQSGPDGEGKPVPAQDIITSTRKRANGPMDKLVQEVTAAELAGLEAPYAVMTYCIFEIAQQQENCACVRTDLPPAEQCSCARVVKGTWDQVGTDAPQQRTLKDVCKGRFHRSRGFMPMDDIKKNFMTNSREVFEAQHTCERPSTHGMVFPKWDRNRHCVTFDFDPENGPVYLGLDPASTHPAAAVWIQHLSVAVQADGWAGEKVWLPAGARVAFAELYKAEMGNIELIEAIKAKERILAAGRPGFRVAARFADPQAKAVRLDMRKSGMPCQWFGATRDIKEQVKHARELMDDEPPSSMTIVDPFGCPFLVDELEHYHYPDKKPDMTDDPDLPVDDFNHAIDAWRYVLINIRQRERRIKIKASPNATPRQHVTAPEKTEQSGGSVVARPRPAVGVSSAIPGDEGWRRQFMGGPIGGGDPWLR